MGAVVSAQSPHLSWLASFSVAAVWRKYGPWHLCLPVRADLGTLEFDDGRA